MGKNKFLNNIGLKCNISCLYIFSVSAHTHPHTHSPKDGKLCTCILLLCGTFIINII